MAVKRKTITVYALLFTLIVSTVGLGLIGLTNANFPPVAFPNSPITEKPIITLLEPTSGTALDNATGILFNITIPSAWNWNNYGLYGRISNVSCSVDGKQIFFDNSTYAYSYVYLFGYAKLH